MKLSFQQRMLLGFGGITATVLAVVLLLANRWIVSRAESELRSRLAQDGRVLQRVHASASRLRLQQLASLAAEPRLRAVVEVEDRDTLEYSADEIRHDLGLLASAFLSPQRGVMVWRGPGRSEIEPRLEHMSARAEARPALGETVRVGDVGVEVQVVPIEVGGLIRGYVVAARALDAAILQDEAVAVGDRVELRAGDRVLAAWPPDERAGRRFRTLDVEMAGALKFVVGVDEAQFSEPLRAAFRAVAFISLGGVALGALAAFFVARRFAAPIAALASTAREVGAGNYSGRAAETGPPELMDLARAFNQTIGSLLRTQRELEASAEGLRGKSEELETISAAMTAFLESGDWNVASARLLQGALRQTRSRGGLVGVVVPGARLRVLASEGADGVQEASRPAGARLLSFDNLVGRVIRAARPVWSSDLESEPGTDELGPLGEGLTQFLGVPILRGGEVVGVIGVVNEAGHSAEERAKLELLANAAGVLIDSYRRQQAEETLQVQFRQAQKMEAVGRLAGGVAHDFNNLLTVIRGQCELLLRRIQGQEPSQRYAKEVLKASDRAAALTRQLLAFSRSQVLEPRLIDASELVANMEDMLHRLVREDVELVTRLDPDLGLVEADPNQLEQVVMNLVVNARDAMPDGGRLEIGTRRVDWSESHPERPPSCAPGIYVELQVRDDGIGMDDATRARIFEPFFTTKPEGQGTGLGLSMVYGIVKQSGGQLLVESEVGRGSTFRVLLPASRHSVAPSSGTVDEPAVRGGDETVLVVEDEAMVRAFVREVLSDAGYRVLESGNGHEALELCARSDLDIDLVLSDAVMPGLNGPQLAERLALSRPRLKVVFMSGYSDAASGSTPPRSEVLLRKPFSGEALLRVLRAELDSIRA